MLQYLDTLIGFAVVMLLISLLITVLTQIVSELLNHRGSNLRWGLTTLFQHIDPTLYPQLAASANRLAHEALRHPLISDSWFSSLRAVRWAEEVPLLGKLLGRVRLASAIRPGELTNLLKQIAAGATPPGVLAPLTAAEWAALQADIDALLAAPNPASAREVRQAATVAAAAVNGIAGQADSPILQDSVNAIRGTAGKLEAWFGSMMDRVAQKFTMYMRLWTVLFAIAFALATGLNSVCLLRELSQSSMLRAALVSASQQTLTTAGTVLDKTDAPASAAASQKAIQDGFSNASQVAAIASKENFDILRNRWPANWDLKYLAGVLITAALLSLGSPFWFNAVKSLTNLRPIVASKEKAEDARKA